MDGNLAKSDERDNPKEHENEPIVYRCGWCGTPTEENGNTLVFESVEFVRATTIIDEFGDIFTKLVNGNCCPNGDN